MPDCTTRVNGFTLIELLFVLVIVAVMATLATVSMSENPSKVLYREAKRLQMVIEFASDEAMMQGMELGFSLPEAGSYQIVSLNHESLKWQAMDDKAFKPFTLDSDVTLSVALPAEFSDKELEQRLQEMQKLGGDAKLQPLILILSSGEITPFMISLKYRNQNARTTVSSDGFSGVIIH